MTVLRQPWKIHPVVDGETILALAVIILLGTNPGILLLPDRCADGRSNQCEHAFVCRACGSNGDLIAVAESRVSDD